jgi:tetratricopeptide (TPR) repeat protein
MSEEALYERYKGALRTGHVAAVRGRNEDAIAAYAEAATLAPDRPLPHTSMGRTLLRLGRVDEALAAFAAALRLAPRDEGGLAGRADALAAAGRPAEAAGVLDLLADTQESAGRLPDACDTARRALELAESRARRRYLETLVAELQSWAPERGGADQLARALRALEVPVATKAAPEPPEPPVRAAEPATEPAEPTVGSADTVVTDIEVPSVPGEALPAVDAAPEAAVPAVPVAPGIADWPAIDLAAPPPDVGALSLAVEAAVSTGDPRVVHRVILDAVADLRRGGLLDAAVDACQLGLTVAPADPDIHLALAELDLDHGWVVAAAEKLVLLSRFVELTGDEGTRQRVRVVMETRLPDDRRLSAHPA